MREKGETWEQIWRSELQSDEILCSKDFCWCSLGGSRGGREENDFRDKQGGRSEMSSGRSSARSFPSAELLVMNDVLKDTEQVEEQEMQSREATKRNG